MNNPSSRPWQALYPTGLEPGVSAEFATVVDAWRHRVRTAPESPALVYFDTTLSAERVDRMSDALAAGLRGLCVGEGGRVGIYLQNIPQYSLTLLALWKLGAAAVVLNPMYRGAELEALVADSGAVGIVASAGDVEKVWTSLESDTAVRWVVSTGDRDLQSRYPADTPARPDGVPGPDLMAMVRENEDAATPTADVGADTLALLAYTSGTTGPAKGAMNTQSNVMAVATSYGGFANVRPGDAVLAIAPLFHITGAVSNAVLALVSHASLVHVGRFDADLVLDAFAEHGVTFTVGSITAYNAILRNERATAEHFASVKTLYSGGAPIPPSTVEQFREKLGHYIHNVYGMTETSSAVIGVPPGRQAPVDPASGTLSIGVPFPGLDVRMVGPDGADVAPGEQGELLMSGPQVISGYWQRPEATRETIAEGFLRSGDVAIMDSAGWIYLVDRMKDQINVSGYKVWPREVEDVLYEHPAVFEAAVIGVPDEYRGESVAAFVSFKAGQTAEQDELIRFAGERLAAYKRPRDVYVVADLPKTQTGKIRRRALRDEYDPEPGTDR